MKIAVFPGSFDPITVGHVDLVRRALPLFDKIIIAIGVNSQKKYLFSLEQRKNWLKDVFNDLGAVEIDVYESLTAKYCEEKNARFILRGLRNAADFDYEKTIAHLNKAMLPEVETILILSKPELSSISSTIVREIIRGKGNVEKFVPAAIANEMTI